MSRSRGFRSFESLARQLAAAQTAHVLLIVFSFALVEVGGLKAPVLVCLAVLTGAGLGLTALSQ